jgi:DNA polymerase-1
MKTLLLIDANSIIHRAFHALPPFTGPDGRPTGALYGISAMMLTLLRTNRPEYAAALFDRPEPTFRDEKYKEYKAQRPPTANELIAQIIEARDLFRAFGIKTFEKPGFEADDLIATLAEKFRNEKDLQVMILTGDRDTLQMVDGEKIVVKIFNKGVSDTTIYDEKAVIEKYGLKPEQLIDYKALVGDNSDNIKGVPGIGPKTAVEIIRTHGTLEKVLAAMPKDEKLQKRLGPFVAEAELSKYLVTLDRNVPLEPAELGGLEDLQLPSVEAAQETIAKYFKTLGSATLLRRLLEGDKPVVAKQPKEPKAAKMPKQPKGPIQPGLF